MNRKCVMRSVGQRLSKLVVDGASHDDTRAAQLAHHESDDVTIERALHLLNGQAITAVNVSPADGSTKFTFDLGCVMTTTPPRSTCTSPRPSSNGCSTGLP